MNELEKFSGFAQTNLSQQQIKELAELKPFARDIFLFDTYVAGTTHVEGIEDLEPFLHVGDRLEFFRDPQNAYDQHAIEIQTENGTKIGFVPKKDNIIFSRLMDAGKLLYGLIKDKEIHGRWVKIYIDIYLHE